MTRMTPTPDPVAEMRERCAKVARLQRGHAGWDRKPGIVVNEEYERGYSDGCEETEDAIRALPLPVDDPMTVIGPVPSTLAAIQISSPSASRRGEPSPASQAGEITPERELELLRKIEALVIQRDWLTKAGTAACSNADTNYQKWWEEKQRADHLTAEIAELRAALEWIQDQQYKMREHGTVTPEASWQAFGKLNQQVYAIFDCARAALRSSPLPVGEK